MKTFSLTPSFRAKCATFTAAILVLTNIQVGALQFVLPIIGTTDAAQASILPDDLTHQVLADLPTSMPSSITIGADQSPFTVRSEVNVKFARYNLPLIPTDYNTSGALRNNTDTLRATCNLFGYSTVVSSKTVWLGDGRTNYSSCGDNKHAVWNGSSMEIQSACGGQWTSQLVCSDPLQPPVPECQDGIDNDGDGATDGDDYGCQVGTKESEPLAQCQDGLDNDNDGGVDSADAIVTGGTPALGGSTYTVASSNPFQVRSFVNSYAAQYGYAPVSNESALYNDTATARQICKMAGYNRVASVSCQSSYGSGCGYTSPSDNGMVKWNGTTFQAIPAVGNNQWISTLVCDQPIQVLPCQDGIDNDNDGRTDMQDPDCTSPRHTSEKPADISCSSPQDNDESPADRPDLRIAKTPEFSAIVRGQQLRYQIDVFNAGTATARSVEIRDRVPSNLTFVPPSPANGCTLEGIDVVCRIPTLTPGEQKTFILTFSTTPATSTCSATTITNRASVTSAEQDGNASDNSVTAATVSLTCPLAQCQDGIDNDSDGRTDYPNDPGCTSATDNDEYNAPSSQCSDGLDNDNDGATDYPNDFSCSSPTDNDETNPKAQCQDGIDNDGDGKTDYPLDPGCTSLQDNDEYNAANITLTSVTANGCTTTVAYTKNFDACAHLLVTSNGQLTHSQNVFCNRNGPVSVQTSAFNSLFQIGTSVKLCNGNNYNDCSAPVTITGTTQCLAQCQDGIDNDGDGATDMQDFSCSSPTDNDETNPKAQCQDGIDNDGDGKTDYPQDPGCSSLQDNDEFNTLPQCSDGIDNDGDGATDMQDFSCSSPTDNDETNPKAQCQDGIDNDGDGRTDYPNDPGCTSLQDNDEFNVLPQCTDGIDNDNDGASDMQDFSCSSPTDNDETNPKAQCQDGIDNDSDGKTDYPLDPGCTSLQDNDEYNVVQTIDLSIVKNSPTPNTVVRGLPITYTLQVGNLGQMTATNVVVTDQIPAGLTFNDALSYGPCTASNNVVTCPVGSFSPNFSGQFQISFDTPAMQNCTNVSVVNTASIAATQQDSNMQNNTSSTVNAPTTITCPVTTYQCNDGLDNDFDGATDMQDFSCSSPTDNDETNPKAQCQDGVDNDSDGKTDYPQDPGCSSLQDNDEYNVPTPACRDGLDNDNDGRTDYPNDPGCSTPDDTNEGDEVACNDRRDNDFDGLIDFPLDPGCASPTDPDEFNAPVTQCSDGIDNDGDGKTDYPQDPGCSSLQDNDEFNTLPQCSDGIDNDGDGATDMQDFSCSSPTDNDETNPKAACQDGYDNDSDGKTDYPQDPGCTSLQDNDEYNVPTPACRDGLDNDNDGRIDMLDPGCSTPDDTNEGDEVACNDRQDNDFDGLIDFPLDPGCASPTDPDEFNAPVTQCSDGIDNDFDGRVDMIDPGCSSPQDNNESDDPACNDRIDNDGDGLIDWPLDPGCVSPVDTNEYNVPLTQCSDGLDNDGDWRVDMNDPGCSSPQDNNEGDDPACSDRIDNDNDGRVDFPLDPGCSSPTDTDETDPYVPQCSDGRDNDYDGKTDMQDPGCSGSQDNDESDDPTLYGCIELNNETFDPHGTRLPISAQFTFVLDATRVAYNDSTGYARFDNVLAGQHTLAEIIPSGWTQYFVSPSGGNLTVVAGTTCAQATFRNRQVFVANAQCNDGYDNDGDGLKDYPSDPGCQSATDNDEYNNTFVPQCRDGLDNDGDGLKDHPQDPGCVNADDNNEQNQGVTYACADGADNDSDGLVDFPSDPGCASATDTDESNSAATYACSNNLDDDGDGLKDYPQDPGCSSAQDNDEFNFRLARCSDGLDNENDGLKDYPQDPGCTTPYDDNEYNDRYWVDRWKEWWNWNW